MLLCFLLPPVSCEFSIDSPSDFAPVTLGEGGALTITFSYRAPLNSGLGLTVKVDVIGFADPSGWPNMNLDPLNRFEEGDNRFVLKGSVRMWGLSPGAVRIRLRLLTPDGTDALAEDEVSYFLDPQSFFEGMFLSQTWAQTVLSPLFNVCCSSAADPKVCVAVGIGHFCDSISNFFIAAKNSTSNSRVSDTTSIEGSQDGNLNAVIGFIDGYDQERLLPFVESLHESGYKGEIHLIPISPEFSCDWENSRSCAHLLSYLKERGAVIHPFPDKIEYCRQHLRHHDYLLRLQLLGELSSYSIQRNLSFVLVVDVGSTIFQKDPFAHPFISRRRSSDFKHGGLLFMPHDEVDFDLQQEAVLNNCWGAQASQSGYGIVRSDFIAGSPNAIMHHAALQLALAWQLISYRGLACTIPVSYFPPRLTAFPSVLIPYDDTFAVSLKGPADLCRMARRVGDVCGNDRMSRQECLNLGCCYHQEWEQDGVKRGPMCLRPAHSLDMQSDRSHEVKGGQVVEVSGEAFSLVIGYDKSNEYVDDLWKRRFAKVATKYFPGRPSGLLLGKGLPSLMQTQERLDDLLFNGSWVGDEWVHPQWSKRNPDELGLCLQGSDVHLFGDSRMRGLSFSLMNQLNSTVNDGDQNLKSAVVPVEAQDICGGNKRYENHVACGSMLGYALELPKFDTVLSFHELFHFDHGPTLAATISQLISDARRAVPRRRLVLVMAPGFHFVSSSPLDAASMMANFLPQIVDAVWEMEDGWEVAYWMTMEPTSGGVGSWPELDHVNEVAKRTLALSSALVLVDTLPLAAPRPDLLVDGSHYAPAYRRIAAQLLVASLCRQ